MLLTGDKWIYIIITMFTKLLFYYYVLIYSMLTNYCVIIALL